jgi:hypothetical protein
LEEILIVALFLPEEDVGLKVALIVQEPSGGNEEQLFI